MKRKIMLNNSTKNKLLVVGVLVFIYLIYWILNRFTPVLLDDCGYGAGIESIKDIIARQKSAYFKENGRVISHFIVQMFCGIFGKSFFNVLNPLILILLIGLIIRHTGQENPKIFSIILALGLIWFLYPDQYVSMFMVAGSVNYVWASALVLAYLILLFKIVEEKKTLSIIQLVLLGLLSFVVGAFVEMYSICVFPALIIWMYVKKIKISKEAITALTVFLLGAVFVVVAPGNFARLGNVVGGGTYNIFAKLFGAFIRFLGEPVSLLLLFILIMFFIIGGKRKNFALVFLRDNSFYISAILFSFLFIGVSGASWSRTFFAIYTFTFILFIKLINEFSFNRVIKAVISVAVIVSIAFDFIGEMKVLEEKSMIVDNCIRQYEFSANENKRLCLTSNFPSKTRKSFDKDFLTIDVDNWRNIAFEEFYNLKNISLLPDCDIQDKLNKDRVSQEVAVFPDYSICCGNKYILTKIHSTSLNSVKIVYSDKDQLMYHPKLKELLKVFRLKNEANRIFNQHSKLLPSFLLENYKPEQVLIKDGVHDKYWIIQESDQRVYLIIENDAEAKLPILSIEIS